jgi:hypothetical protein
MHPTSRKLDLGEISDIERGHLRQNRNERAAYFSPAVSVSAIYEESGPDILKIVILLKGRIIEKGKTNLQRYRSVWAGQSPFSEEMAHSLRKPNLSLKADHLEMVPEHTHDLTRGSGYKAAEVASCFDGFL